MLLEFTFHGLVQSILQGSFAYLNTILWLLCYFSTINTMFEYTFPAGLLILKIYFGRILSKENYTNHLGESIWENPNVKRVQRPLGTDKAAVCVKSTDKLSKKINCIHPWKFTGAACGYLPHLVMSRCHLEAGVALKILQRDSVWLVYFQVTLCFHKWAFTSDCANTFFIHIF